MRQAQTTLTLQTNGKGLYECTAAVEGWVRETGIEVGLLTVFVRHTSASLTIQENADPDVQRDLATFFEKLAPENAPWYRHTMEGPDDMPAHLRSALTDVSLSIPVSAGQTTLGTWQGLYLFEHRRNRHSRQIVLHLMGE